MKNHTCVKNPTGAARAGGERHKTTEAAMRYEYEHVELKNNPLYQAKVEDGIHRRIIDARAAQGCRFVAMIPTLEGASGKTLAYDLVFEVPDAAPVSGAAR